MESDSFFCQLLKQLPQTLFELLGQPGERARDYHFDSVEIKKSFRIDGVFVPIRANLPVIGDNHPCTSATIRNPARMTAS